MDKTGRAVTQGFNELVHVVVEMQYPQQGCLYLDITGSYQGFRIRQLANKLFITVKHRCKLFAWHN